MGVFKVIATLLIAGSSVWAFSLGGIMAVIGLIAAGYSFFNILSQDERWIPIGEIALALAGWQWIVSPMISYTMADVMFSMSQGCDQYMLYTVPMYLCFEFGYYRWCKPFTVKVEDITDICRRNEQLAKYFIFIGIAFLIIPVNIPAIVQFLKYTSLLMYIGFIMLMISRPRKATLYMVIPLSITLLISISSGMFHELITWGVMLMMVWFRTKKVDVKRKIAIFLVCLLAINTLQTIKTAYRQIAWYGYKGNKVELFFEMITNSSTIASTKEDGNDNNSRYNQGWIISMIYDYVPSHHDYFYGRTFKDAFVSTLLPRFLAPNKKGSGKQVQDDFREMTGYPLGDNTSMGLSILGEAYGNFGLLGGALFMLFWGWFIGKVMDWANIWSRKYCFLWILMLPIIGFVLVEAEISMITVLNWTVKGIVFAYIVVYLSKKCLVGRKTV